MFTFMFNLFTRSILVLLAAMMTVNYLPDKLFHDFPLDPLPVTPLDYDSVIPKDWNTKLSDGQPEFIQLNNILGPESIAISPESGLIYTGLADGRLVELDPKSKYQVRTVLRSKGCKDNEATNATECGRFLGMKFNNNTLYAVEANTGLYKVDPKANSKTFLGPKPLHKVNLYNSAAFDPKEPNLVYITISSTKWDLLNIMWSLIEQDQSSQLVVLDLETGKRAVVAENLRMANGIDVDAKRDQLIFTETMKSRVNSIALKNIRSAFKSSQDGSKLMAIEISPLIPLLPGIPDNIVIDGDTAYIALPFVKLGGKELIDHLGSMTNVRKVLGRFTYGLGQLLEYVSNNLYEHPMLVAAYRELKCGHVNYRITQSDKSAVIKYHLDTGASILLGSENFGFVSEATPDHQGNLLLASFRSPFIVKQKINW